MLRVRHREYINPIDVENAAFERPSLTGLGFVKHAPLRYSVNPGDGTTFPWLSGLATRFEKYKFNSIRISYKPSCPTTTQGGLALVAVYDPADTVPSRRNQLFNAESCVRGAVYDSMTMDLKKYHLTKELHVRALHHGLVDANELRLSDVGYFVAVVMNTNTDIQFGDLFIEYDITLRGPKVGDDHAKSAWMEFTGDGTSMGFAPFALTPYNNTANSELTVDPGNHMNPKSTLKVDISHDGTTGHRAYVYNSTINDNDTHCTRLRFREPFSGVMTLHCDPDNFGENSSIDIGVNHVTRPSTDVAVRASTEPIGNIQQQSGQTGHTQFSYAVNANGGDVIDLIGRSLTGIGSWAGKIAVAFNQASPALMESAEILGFAI